MAKGKRVKREDLDELKAVPCTFLGQLTEDGPLHMIVEKGAVIYGSGGIERGRTLYNVTACNRVTRWPHRKTSIRGYSLCSRCGSEQDFETAAEQWKGYLAQIAHDRRLKKQMQDSEFEIDMQWSDLGVAIEQMIMDDATDLIESGTVLVPFTPEEISRVSGLLLVCINKINALKNPREFEERQLKIARDAMYHLDDYR